MAWKLRFVRKLQQTGGTAAPNVGFEKIQNVKQMHFFLDKSKFGVETEKLKLLDYEKKIYFFFRLVMSPKVTAPSFPSTQITFY